MLIWCFCFPVFRMEKKKWIQKLKKTPTILFPWPCHTILRSSLLKEILLYSVPVILVDSGYRGTNRQTVQHTFVVHTYYFSTQGTDLALFSVLDPAAALSFWGLVVWAVAPFKKACMTPLDFGAGSRNTRTNRDTDAHTDTHIRSGSPQSEAAARSFPWTEDTSCVWYLMVTDTEQQLLTISSSVKSDSTVSSSVMNTTLRCIQCNAMSKC